MLLSWDERGRMGGGRSISIVARERVGVAGQTGWAESSTRQGELGVEFDDLPSRAAILASKSSVKCALS